MNVQTSLFWLTGIAFFAVQLGLLLRLLRQSRSAQTSQAEGARVEIVWTLVPASLIAALALMLGGLTRGAWTDADQSPRPAPAMTMRWAGPDAKPPADSRR